MGFIVDGIIVTALALLAIVKPSSVVLFAVQLLFVPVSSFLLGNDPAIV